MPSPSWVQRLEREKLESLAEFAAGAGHEINNPVAVIFGRAQLLLASETNPERRRALLTIAQQATRIHEMINDVMLFARPPEPNREVVDLRPLVAEVVDSLREAAPEQGVALEFQPLPQPVFASVDPVQFRVVVLELVRNGLEAVAAESSGVPPAASAAGARAASIDRVGPGGAVEVTLAREGCDASRNGKAADRRGRLAVLRVADNGPGLTDEASRHLFDPFYSGRQAGRGLGFGLSKCWRIVRSNHGGTIEASNRAEGGAMFVVSLPAAESPTRTARSAR